MGGQDHEGRAGMVMKHRGLAVRNCIGLLFVTLLAGQFSLDRVEPSWSALGLFGYLTFWAFVPFLLTASSLPSIRHYQGLGIPLKQVRLWTHCVALGHLYLIATALWTPDPLAALPDMALLVVPVVAVLLLPRLFAADPERLIDFLLILWYVTALLYCVGGLLGPVTDQGRVVAFGGGANVYVRVVSVGAFAATHLWLRRRSALWLLPMPVMVMCAILSGSRGGVFAFFVIYPVFAFPILRNLFARRRFMTVLSVALVCVAFGIVLYNQFGDAVYERWVVQTFEQRYVSERPLIALEAMALFRENPLVGVGFKGYRELSELGAVYPHNLILDVAVESGVVGLAVFAAPLLLLAARLRRPYGPAQRIALFIGGYYAVASMFSGSYFDARWMWVFWGLFMLPASNDHRPAGNHFRRRPRPFLPAR